jgi:hypothetical protein
VGGELIIALDPAHCVRPGDRQNSSRHAERLFATSWRKRHAPTVRSTLRRAAADTDAGITIPQMLYESYNGWLRQTS